MTIHLSVADHATKGGSYVALSSARHQTTIHATADPDVEGDRLGRLAARMSRTEPQVPSIDPLAYETAIAPIAADEHHTSPPDPVSRPQLSPDTGLPRYVAGPLGPPPPPISRA